MRGTPHNRRYFSFHVIFLESRLCSRRFCSCWRMLLMSLLLGLKSERVSIMKHAVKSSFKTGLYISLRRSIIETPVYLLTKTGFQPSNRRSLLLRRWSWTTVAEFIDSDWGDKVNSSCSLAGRYNNPMPEFTLSPSRRSMNFSERDKKQTMKLRKILKNWFQTQWCSSIRLSNLRALIWTLLFDMFRGGSNAPFIRSHWGTMVVFPHFYPMRVSEEQVCIYIFRQNPVLTTLHLR